MELTEDIKAYLKELQDYKLTYVSEKVCKFMEDNNWIIIPSYCKLYLGSYPSPISCDHALQLFHKHGYDIKVTWNTESKIWKAYVGKLNREKQEDIEYISSAKSDNYHVTLNKSMEYIIDNKYEQS